MINKIKNLKESDKHYFIFFGVAIFIIYVIFFQDTTNTTHIEKSTKKVNNTFNNLPILNLPESSTFWKSYYAEVLAPFTIKTSGDSNYLIKMTEHYTGKEYIKIFVRGGESVKIKVPLGDYDIKYLSGNNWYGIDSKNNYVFGEDTSFNKADEVFSFYETDEGYSGNIVELYKSAGGNLHTSKLNPEDF